MVKLENCLACHSHAVLERGLCYNCRVKNDRTLGNVITYMRSKTIHEGNVDVTYTELMHNMDALSNSLTQQLVRKCVELADELLRTSAYLPSSICQATGKKNCDYCDALACPHNTEGKDA